MDASSPPSSKVLKLSTTVSPPRQQIASAGGSSMDTCVHIYAKETVNGSEVKEHLLSAHFAILSRSEYLRTQIKSLPNCGELGGKLHSPTTPETDAAEYNKGRLYDLHLDLSMVSDAVNSFKLFLNYLYGGRINLTEEGNAESLLYLAKLCGFTDLETEMNMQLAEKQAIVEKLLEVMANNNSSASSNSVLSPNLSLSTPTTNLSPSFSSPISLLGGGSSSSVASASSSSFPSLTSASNGGFEVPAISPTSIYTTYLQQLHSVLGRNAGGFNHSLLPSPPVSESSSSQQHQQLQLPVYYPSSSSEVTTTTMPKADGNRSSATSQQHQTATSNASGAAAALLLSEAFKPQNKISWVPPQSSQSSSNSAVVKNELKRQSSTGGGGGGKMVMNRKGSSSTTFSPSNSPNSSNSSTIVTNGLTGSSLELLVPSSDKEGWCRNKKYIQIVKKGYRCLVCNKVYGRYNSVSYHVTIYHRNPPIRCEEEGCQFTTREARYIHFHKYYRHQIPLPESIDLASRKCPLAKCKHVSKSPAMLDKHIHRHVTDCFKDGVYYCGCMEQQQIEEPAAVVVVKEEPADTELCTEPSKTAAAVCKYTTNSHETMYDHLLSKHLSGGGNALQLPSSNSTSILSSGESLSPQEDAQKQIPGTEKKQQDVKPSQQGRFQCRTLANLEQHKMFKHSSSIFNLNGSISSSNNNNDNNSNNTSPLVQQQQQQIPPMGMINSNVLLNALPPLAGLDPHLLMSSLATAVTTAAFEQAALFNPTTTLAGALATHLFGLSPNSLLANNIFSLAPFTTTQQMNCSPSNSATSTTVESPSTDLMVAQKVAALLAMPSGHDPRGMF